MKFTIPHAADSVAATSRAQPHRTPEGAAAEELAAKAMDLTARARNFTAHLIRQRPAAREVLDIAAAASQVVAAGIRLDGHRVRPRSDIYTTAVLEHPEQLQDHLAAIEPGLVVLIGASGAGKSTVAVGFTPDQVSSLDHYRFLLSGDPGDQSATEGAVALQRQILISRLTGQLLTVIDSTSVESHVRRDLTVLAAAFDRSAVAVILDTPLDVCLARNANRPSGRRVPENTVRWQHDNAMAAATATTRLHSEGFAATFILRTTPQTRESA